MVEKMVKPQFGIGQGNMCGEFGEVTVIIGLVINFLAVCTLLLNSRDTLSYVLPWIIYNDQQNFGSQGMLERQ